MTRLALLREKLPLIRLYVGSTGSLMLGTVAQLVTFVVLARHLGVEVFGQLMTITAATNLAAQLCGLGSSEGLVRRVARDPAEYKLLLGHNLILMLATGALLTAALTFGLGLIVRVSPDPRANALILLAFAASNILLYRFVLLVEQIFIARAAVARANLVNVCFGLARAAAATIGCVLFGVTSLEAWALWHAGVHVAAAVACVVAIRRYGAPRWRLIRSEIPLGIHFSTPWPFWSLRQNIDLLILSVVAPPAVVGSFSVVKRIIDTSFLPMNSLNRLLYPKLAVVGKAGAGATLSLTLRLLKLIVALAAVTSLSLFAIAPFLPTLFGPGFAGMVGSLQVLCFVLIVVAVQNAAYEALGGAERHGVRALVYNAGSAVAAILIAALTWLFLLPGTFVAIYAGEALVAAGLWITLFRLARPRRQADDSAPLPMIAAASPAGIKP